MPGVQELLAELQPNLGQVQPASHEWVCACCMGPVNPPWEQCFACDTLERAGTPPALMERVAPASIAINPGRWYNRLKRYKGGYPAYRGHLAALAWSFIDRHELELSTLLGGEHTAIVPVPSKRGRTFESQPLRQAISMVRPMGELLLNALTYVPSADAPDLRRSYYPQCFDQAADTVLGHRILVIEDTWVTGATALSAAGALMDHGAKSVVILAIARVLDLAWWGRQGSVYVTKVEGEDREPFDLERWPRGE